MSIFTMDAEYNKTSLLCEPRKRVQHVIGIGTNKLHQNQVKRNDLRSYGMW